MGNMYIVNMRGDDDDERQARQEAERLRLRGRYEDHLVQSTGMDASTAKRVMMALFDPATQSVERCQCGCHPSLSALHDDGFDCPCTWDDSRRAKEHSALADLWDGPELREQHAIEEDAIAAWISGQPGVQAERTTSFVPEQWEGSVDGHSFYFRERGGIWRIELDLEATGNFADRFVDVGDDGELITEPVPIMDGHVIAEGVQSQLGDSSIDHIAFIVRTIRDHLWSSRCDHWGALFFCPKCGQRMDGPT